MKQVEGGITAPKGYRASGVPAGIKLGSTKKDCALIVSDVIANVAGMFTKNVMISPPAKRNKTLCTDRGTARAVFINSGNANAATGKQGDADVLTTCTALAEALDIDADDAHVGSTGVIGVPLPMDRILQGIADATAALTPDGSLAAAEAIMTTDLVAKEFACEVELSSGTVRIGSIAKGSGMIAPDMATMICILTSDVTASSDTLRELLKPAVDDSFHRMCIDNDMSTSDTVLLLANGAAKTPELQPDSEDFQIFQTALTETCQAMARALVKDGEGATKFVEILVEGTQTDEDAKTIARAIANSQLCKTAFYGEDPNWGRFACAAGYAGIPFDPDHLTIRLEDLTLTEGGVIADFEEDDAAAIMKRPEFSLTVSIGSGPGQAVFWTSDLSQGYVSINADYRT